MLATTIIAQIYIVLESYIFVSRLIKYSITLNSMGSVVSFITIILYLKRLVHLTSLIYSFQRRVSDIEDKLFDLEVRCVISLALHIKKKNNL